MWHIVRLAPRARPGSSTVDELVRSTAQGVMVITSAFYLLCAIVLAGNAAADVMIRLLALATVQIVAGTAALRWLSGHYLIAQITWQATLAAALILAARWLDQPEIAVLYALLPLITAVTLGPAGGLAGEALVIAVTAWATSDAFARPLPPEFRWVLPLVGVFTGLLGWAITNPLLTVSEWSLAGFREAQKHLEEAREQRLILKQTEEDLLKANRELARLSDRLKALQRMAEEASQAKAEFVANVSHELRTPLNMIIGFTEIIARSPQVYGGRLPPALQTDIAAVRRNSQHLANLVNDVLDLSQVEAGRMALSREWTALPEVIEAAVTTVKPLFDSKGLYLRTEIPSDLPRVFCDGTRVRQVVINLLSNAGRFTEHGGVLVACRRSDSQITISVTDTGPGIPPEDQQRLFEPFQQLDASIRRRYGGSGLGLTISKQFVEMHGGQMWIESQLGTGTTIGFNLPLTSAPPAEPTASARRSLIPDDERGYRTRLRPTRAAPPVAPPRLVVLEKERTLQRLLARYLPGTELAVARTVPAAIAELSRSPAQALIVNASPLEAIPVSALTDLPFDTPAVTCWIPGEDDAARRLGVVQYLVKPVTAETLKDALARLPQGVKTVLIVDDEPDELHLFARMLAADANGYRLLQVTNGQRALDMLRTRRPDVMLLDLVMAGMDGFQVLEEKGRDPAIRDIPVIVISSRDPTGDPVVSNTLTVTHGRGLSVRNLLACIQAIGEILSPVK